LAPRLPFHDLTAHWTPIRLSRGRQPGNFAGGGAVAAAYGALAKLKRFPAITHAGAVRCVLRSLSRFALGQTWTRSVSRGPGHFDSNASPR
jgi:hypothetical protein